MLGIQSGDTIFLSTRSGAGNFLNVNGEVVRAEVGSRGDWEAFRIEAQSGGNIMSGDTVFLTSHTGALVHVDGESVQAGWNDMGTLQSLIIEKPGGGEIWPHDIICLKAHTGKFIETNSQSNIVGAHWDQCAREQGFRIDKEEVDAIFSASYVFLKAPTEKLLDVEDNIVKARYNAEGDWQKLQIKNQGGRAIFSGDVVAFTSWTSKFLDVEGTQVRARYYEEGEWQQFTIERAVGQGVVLPGDIIHLRAHTGRYIDVEGETVAARWDQRDWRQSLEVSRSSTRRMLHESRDDNSNSPDSQSAWQWQAPSGCSAGALLGVLVSASVLALVAAPVVRKRRVESLPSLKVYPTAKDDYNTGLFQ